MEQFKTAPFESEPQKQLKPRSFEEFIKHQDISELPSDEQEKWLANPDPERVIYSLYLEDFYNSLNKAHDAYSLFIEDYYTNAENKLKVDAGEKPPKFEDWIETQK